VSPGWFTLGGAAIGAGVAVLTVWLRESYARHLDQKSLAAALLAEVEVLLKAVVVERGVHAQLYKLLLERPLDEVTSPAMRRLEKLEKLLETQQKGGLDYRVSIYEKCAQQIGHFDPEVGKGLGPVINSPHSAGGARTVLGR
jgi:hypothetical protein